MKLQQNTGGQVLSINGPYIPWDHGEGTPNTACSFKVNFLEMMLYKWVLEETGEGCFKSRRSSKYKRMDMVRMYLGGQSLLCQGVECKDCDDRRAGGVSKDLPGVWACPNILGATEVF